MEVIGLVRKKANERCYFQIEECDLTRSVDVKRVITKIKPDFVLHLAGKNNVLHSWQDPAGYINSNVMGTVYLLENLRIINPIARVVIAGSALEFNPDTNFYNQPYGISKNFQTAVSGIWQQLFNLQVIIAKPSNLIGPGPSSGVCSLFAQRIAKMEEGKEKEALHIANLTEKRDFLDVRDAVEAYRVLLKKGKPGEIYELGTGTFRSLDEVAKVFKTLSNVNFDVVSQIPPEGNHTNSIPYQYTSLNKIYELGLKPKYSFQDSLSDILNYSCQTLLS
jgi:GDP-4-dehydro-6-deoxy-D-mannose reductase